jgi:hypothetical protein
MPLTLADISSAPCAPAPKYSKPSMFANLFGGGFKTRKTEEKKSSSIKGKGYGSGLISETQADTAREWYLELLGTQQADGHFTGKAVVAEYFKLTEKDLDNIISQIDVPGDDRGEKALITLLAVNALKRDPDAVAVSRRAVKKAEKWLSRNAPAITVNGISVNNYIQTQYNIKL